MDTELVVEALTPATPRVVRALADALARAGVGDVLSDHASRAHYSSDASLYRLVPAVVVRPRDAGEVAATMDVARTYGVPIVPRGGGTSVAGNAISTGVVMDFSKHMNQIVAIDPQARTATVQPGVIQSHLQRAAGDYGLLFGPDPSTMTRCTIGGMIGNNACGSRTLGYGRTSDNVRALELLTAHGEELLLTAGQNPLATERLQTVAAPQALPPALGERTREMLESLRDLVRENLAVSRTEFATFGRQVSGYAVDALLPENRFDLTRFMVGSEGTLGVITQATVDLIEAPAFRTLVVLGFEDIVTAADATMAVLGHQLTACEGLDARIVQVVRERRGPQAVPALPRGDAWLFAEVSGDDEGGTAERALRLAQDVGCLDSRIVTKPNEAAALWRIRADGAGLSGRSITNRPAHAGWEDAAVPPARLGAYLREFEALLTGHGLAGFPFGHFGDGCMHVRLDFALDRPGGVAQFGEFLDAAAELVGNYGGSMSGEHGDGRARSAYLPKMYSPAALNLFGDIKNIFDPHNLLNPGVLTSPASPTADLRVPQAPPLRRNLAFAYDHDDADFSTAVHRCTGVGKCRADNDHGVMCPSYLATRDEKDSTRGRARVLQEMVNGSFVDGWASPAVHDSLDLCLACKGCASDCPTGVDMAAYKAEVLHQTYRGRRRPVAHYSLGWLPRWSRIASRTPRLVNALMRAPVISKLALSAAGVDKRRSIPLFAKQSFRRAWNNSLASRRQTDQQDRGPVVLFVDTFTDNFSPDAAHAAVHVLQAVGFSVEIIEKSHCCGLTWISTGQLDTAKRLLTRTVSVLAVHAAAGTPIVGLEPSCTAVLRSDAVELLATPSAKAVAAATHTLGELLTEVDWIPPDLDGMEVVAQPHCHHHAIMGWDTDQALLKKANVQLTAVSGCCGLAGNFGVEKGHYDVSVAVANQHLLPAVRSAPNATVLADGFSCRTQLADLVDTPAVHMAELFAAALPSGDPDTTGGHTTSITDRKS